MLSDLINQLIKTIHDLITHQGAATAISDVATTAADVAGVIPEVLAPNAALVADAVNAVVSVAQNQLPGVIAKIDPKLANAPATAANAPVANN